MSICSLVCGYNLVPCYSDLFRLVVTENAQCYLWNQWCSANKNTRNAKISHMENPAKSDAVKFFLHVLDSDTYSSFNFKPTLYSHFQRLLGTPDKVLLLTDANFAGKVNPMRKYPACEIDTANLFDEEGDPLFVVDVQPCSPDPASTPTTKSSKKSKGSSSNTGLKRTLCAKTPKKKRSKKNATPTETNTPVETSAAQPVSVPTPTPTDMPGSSSKPKPKPYRQPQLLTLPSTLARPIDDSDHQFLSFLFLPTAGLTGHSLFQSFVTFCSASEQHAVLVSRAYVSQTYTKQGQMLAIRQVPFITVVFQIQLTVSLAMCVAPFFFCTHSLQAWYIPQDWYSHSVRHSVA